MTMVTSPLAKLTFAVAALLLSLSAFAGSVSFQLSLTGSQLTLKNQGSGSAYYPAVFRLLDSGAWEQLAAATTPAELAAGAQLELIWPDQRPLEQLSALARLQPVMVRFFDEAGVGFGQISFFHGPPAAKTALRAGYVGDTLQVEPPDAGFSIRASWVLWPQEEGIAPIRLPLSFEHRQPPALRIDWLRQGRLPLQLDTGAGRPAAILLHETEQGYTQQFVPDGGLQGRQQRAPWLDATQKFYTAAQIAMAFAAAAMLLQFLRRPRRRAVP
jgi:hypothetical protein